MIEILSYQYMQNAILAGLLASLLCGFIGIFIVVNRIVFISGGLSHISFGGLGLAFYLNADPFLGAGISAVLASIVLGVTKESKVQRNDTLIGILWSMGMALGILFIYLKPGYSPDLTTYLFGNILTVSMNDIYFMIALNVLVLLLFGLSYHEIMAISFDKEFAKIKGVAVKQLNLIFYILTALTIVVLIEVVGIILIIALLTIPPSISLILSRSFKIIIILSMIVSLCMILGGLFISYQLDIPPGPAIIIPGGVILLAINLVKKIAIK